MIENSLFSVIVHGLCSASRAGLFGEILTVSIHGIGNCSSAPSLVYPYAYGTESSQSA
jgi:hypothetical protein